MGKLIGCTLPKKIELIHHAEEIFVEDEYFECPYPARIPKDITFDKEVGYHGNAIINIEEFNGEEHP